MNKKTWIIFGVICVAIFGGLIAYSRAQNPSVSIDGVNANAVIAASSKNGNIADHVQGSTNSKVVLVEYGDFQCPSCGGAHPGVKQITQDYGDKITFIFRNFPLTSLHPNAVAAATAVEAAGLQGKYWDMHNLVFESQDAWSNLSAEQRTAKFVEYASQVGVKDLDTFKKDQSDKRISNKIAFDQALGKQAGTTGTPTFLLNGEKVDSEVSGKLVQGDATAMRSLLNTKLKENGIALPN